MAEIFVQLVDVAAFVTTMISSYPSSPRLILRVFEQDELVVVRSTRRLPRNRHRLRSRRRRIPILVDEHRTPPGL
eukprot:3954293-Heterocapsa_arctica.AAC.1